MTMIQKLTDGWKLRSCSTGQSFETKVPGTVYGTWLEQGAMKDPYWRDCEEAALAMMAGDYEYEISLSPDEALMGCRDIRLRFEGIDTLADIFFNGVYLGHADNMHRIWEYPVKSLMGETNKIKVHLYSPLSFIRKAYEKTPYDGAPEAMQGFPLLRKSHCSFGWDWGPRLPDAGLFREVSLIGVNQASICDVHIRQRHSGGIVTLTLNTTVEAACDVACSCMLRITDPQGMSITYQMEGEKYQFSKAVTIKNPELWWPNGYGKQPLYQAEVMVAADGELQDSWRRKIGLRTMTVNTAADEYGNKFAHEVNGVEIFAMGADYIPEDCIRGRDRKSVV